MEFSLKQLFFLADSKSTMLTDIQDVYSIIDTLTGRNIKIEYIPAAIDFIKSKSPACLQELTTDINKVYEVGKMTPEELEGFGEYMLQNGPIKHKT